MTTKHKNSKRWLRDITAGPTGLTDIRDLSSGISHLGTPLTGWFHSSFENLALNLLYASRPNEMPSLEEFEKQLISNRKLPVPAQRYAAQATDTGTAKPLDIFRTVLSICGNFDPDGNNGSEDALLRKATRIIAMTPSIIGTIVSANHDIEDIPTPNCASGYAAYLYWNLLGKDSHPNMLAILLERSIMTYADHAFAASTFACRMAAGTDSDIYSGVLSALGIMKGWRHGGASQSVMDRILCHADVISQVDELRTSKVSYIPGFGHPTLQSGDCRVKIIENLIKTNHDLLNEVGRADFYERYLTAVESIQSINRVKDRSLHPNVEFINSVLFGYLGIRSQYYPLIFVAGRIVGWCSHFLEHRRTGEYIRPNSLYVEPKRSPPKSTQTK